MDILKNEQIPAFPFDQCHGGKGTLFCQSVLKEFGSREFAFMHSDKIAAGVSIGEHRHEKNEEIYYLVSGKGVLTYDGKQYDMEPGDVSLCTVGHSHAFLATQDSHLIVVGGVGHREE